MEFQDEACRTLTLLGLTHGQARVYLALVRSEIATVKTISNVSKIHRQGIYRIVSTLQKLGLVEKALTTPTMFKASPIQDGLSILMERKIDETHELQKKKRITPEFQKEQRKNDTSGRGTSIRFDF